MQDEDKEMHSRLPPPIRVRVIEGEDREREMRFTQSFLIGRLSDCQLQIDDPRVSRVHTQVFFDGDRWWVRDLESANGTFLDGTRIQDAPLPAEASLELGRGGPLLSLAIEGENTPEKGEQAKAGPKDFSSETQMIRYYFRKDAPDTIGEHTMMFRRAFEKVHRKKSRKYLVAVGLALSLLIAAGGVILYQQSKFHRLRTSAENIFYAMKSIELQIGQLEDALFSSASADLVAELKAKREKLRGLEKEYDGFVRDLGIYKKLPEEERIMLTIARTFGECELNMPKDFVKEVKSYIQKWKSTERLEKSLNRAKQNRYIDTILQVLEYYDLPPQYFYVALQESAFNDKAVGPKTRFGFAKGMWQFITITADRYGLQIGPLYDEGVYDPRDERFNFLKATNAAARYIRDLNNTEAQASGLLVIACYNWGEANILPTVSQMPQDPRERNFWRLLATRRIPQETYDYVFYIFSAAVIGENPQLFGFDFAPPLAAKRSS
jgi:pSer/pThr/pTyr-binding forkhead associated (FHA) protein